MNPDLLSNTASLALLAITGALLLAHLSQVAGAHRLRHVVDALTCGGLIYLFGMRAFGWSVLPKEALSVVFLLLAIGVATFGWRRESGGEDDFPWRLTAVQAAAMAYVFGPLSFWKPAASLLLLFFFALETMRWLSGTEEALTEAQRASPHPPLFPPKRTRGLREFALAGTTAVLTFVFAVGTGRAPPPPAPETPDPVAESAVESAVETPAPAEQSAQAETPAAENAVPPDDSAKPASAPASSQNVPAVPATYTTVAGDTFKTIAKKLYGASDKWRSLATANPGLKPGAKFRAGVAIRLPVPPASR